MPMYNVHVRWQPAHLHKLFSYRRFHVGHGSGIRLGCYTDGSLLNHS